MATLWAIVATIAFPLAILAVFLSATLAWVIISTKAQSKLEAYRQDFTTSASSNMADMFMFVDPNRLFRK